MTRHEKHTLIRIAVCLAAFVALFATDKSLGLAADKFVKTYGIELPLRFDIVSVIGTGDNDCVIRHIEDAFMPW